MRGYLEIFKGPIKSENLIFSEYNLIVDQAGEHAVDILTTLPATSAVEYAQTSSTLDLGIKAISLGCASSSHGYNYYDPSAVDSGPSSLMPVPPTPMDETLQPPIFADVLETSGPGRLGHFLNYYEFSGSYPTLHLLDIRQHGCYLPSGGIDFAGSSFGYTHPGPLVNDMSGIQTGDLNSVSAINSEGFILESRVARTSQTTQDASGGFIVSGNALEVSATREVRYILTINYKDWKFLDYYYGGIGAIGLWTLDRDKTLMKYQDESETAKIDLYNIADITKNPVFKLFSKKVFLPGGLDIDLATGTHTDYLTISWSIKF